MSSRAFLPFLRFCLLAWFWVSCQESVPVIEKIPVRALSEPLPSYFVKETDAYDSIMRERVVPYLQAHSQTGVLAGDGGLEIAYRISKPDQAPKASVVMIHGWTESLRALNEITYYFLQNNYAVYALDLRGHGYSGRTGIHPDQTDVVASFDEYVRDLKIFLDEVVRKDLGDKRPMLYAHSLGGLVGGLFLQDHPGYFQAAVLSTPMTEMNTGGFPRFVADGSAALGMLIGKQRDFCPGQGPFDPNYDTRKGYTTSHTRFAYYYQTKKDDPKLQAWGASFRWYYYGRQATHKLLEPERSRRIDIPVLFFQAGNDGLIEYETGDRLAAGVANRTVVTLPGAKHLVYLEQDATLFPYVLTIMEFFDKNLSPAPER